MKHPDSFTGRATIETAKKGADIKTIRNGVASKKTFNLEGFCRVNKKYELSDTEDISSFKYLKKGAEVEIVCNY